MKLKLASLLIVLGLAGCQQSGSGQVATTTDNTPVAVDSNNSSSSSDRIDNAGPINTGPIVDSSANTGTVLPPTDAELRRTTTLFFDFDRAELRADHQQVLGAHARYLLENPGLKMRLEGHADERGSREYNVGLGQRRAQAVKRNLTLQGVQNSQLNTISYGEEKPIDPGHNEYAWQSNRRVELVYFN